MIRDAPPLCRSFPSLLVQLVCLQGKSVVRDKIAAALEHGSAWLDCYWYKPGTNTPALKHTYVRQVKHNGGVYILGSGLYPLKTSGRPPGRRTSMTRSTTPQSRRHGTRRRPRLSVSIIHPTLSAEAHPPLRVPPQRPR
jgi:hypothetical protein